MIVLFTSQRPLSRAENLRTVFDAYDGDKVFEQMGPHTRIRNIEKYDLQVTDELPSHTPGKCLFIGHGMGAGKTYGLDQPRAYFNSPELVSYAIASSHDMVPIVAPQIGISESQVIPLGMPRTDAYFEPHKTEGYSLYAPTFRGGSWLPDFAEIHRHMPEDMKIVVKAHPITGRIGADLWSGISEASSDVPTTPYLMGAEKLITDYSSIMFDAMVMRKPVVLFAKDRREYLQNRGMYFLYPQDYSKFYCETEKDFVDIVQAAEWDNHAEAMRNFYTGSCDGHSTERTIDLIKEILCES